MVFIWGSGSKVKNSNNDRVLYPCPRCQDVRGFAVIENYRYGHVYGIRIAKWNASQYLICFECQFQIIIPTKLGFANAKILDQVLDSMMAINPTQSQIWRIIARVADEVLGHPEAVAYARSVAADFEQKRL